MLLAMLPVSPNGVTCLPPTTLPGLDDCGARLGSTYPTGGAKSTDMSVSMVVMAFILVSGLTSNTAISKTSSL